MSDAQTVGTAGTMSIDAIVDDFSVLDEWRPLPLCNRGLAASSRRSMIADRTIRQVQAAPASLARDMGGPTRGRSGARSWRSDAPLVNALSPSCWHHSRAGRQEYPPTDAVELSSLGLRTPDTAALQGFPQASAQIRLQGRAGKGSMIRKVDTGFSISAWARPRCGRERIDRAPCSIAHA